MKEPKDLRIDISTEDGVFWNDLKKKSNEIILGSEREIIIQREIIALCDKKIDEENAKLKD